MSVCVIDCIVFLLLRFQEAELSILHEEDVYVLRCERKEDVFDDDDIKETIHVGKCITGPNFSGFFPSTQSEARRWSAHNQRPSLDSRQEKVDTGLRGRRQGTCRGLLVLL